MEAKEGSEPRPLAVLCQEWALAISQQVYSIVFTLLIKPT